MRRGLLTIVLLVPLAASGCGGASTNPTAELSACLESAGAKRATDAGDLSFAVTTGADSRPGPVRADRSGTLNVGLYRGTSNGGWAIFYAVRRGYSVKLGLLLRQPEKGAKLVAYLHPSTVSALNAAKSCL